MTGDGCIASRIGEALKTPAFRGRSSARLSPSRRGVVGRDRVGHQGSGELRGSTLSRCRVVGRRQGEEAVETCALTLDQSYALHDVEPHAIGLEPSDVQ